MTHVCSAHISQETMISDNQNSGTAVLATTKSTTTTETTTTGTLLDTFFGHDTRESEGIHTYIQLCDFYRFYGDLHPTENVTHATLGLNYMFSISMKHCNCC